jgi:hypothetical protein
MCRPRPRNARLATGGPLRCGALCLVLVGLGVCGCQGPTVQDLQARIGSMEQTLAQRDNEIAALNTSIAALNRRLAVARAIAPEDLKRVYYPEKLVIDRLSGGDDYDDQPGDDGVTVYLKPVDRDGDVIKVAGDIRIQLYDLAASPGRELIGEYAVPIDQVGKLWNGKLVAGHYTIRCPWPQGPPQNPEVTIRATFVDYFTQRVVSAQHVVTVHP